MGKMLKGLVKFTVAAATVSGVCYLFKDKIKESHVYEDYNIDDKIKKVKKTIKEKMPNPFEKEEDIVAEDEIFFDDLDFSAENAERDYVSINSDDEADDSANEDANNETDNEADTTPTVE